MGRTRKAQCLIEAKGGPPLPKAPFSSDPVAKAPLQTAERDASLWRSAAMEGPGMSAAFKGRHFTPELDRRVQWCRDRNSGR